MVSSAQPAARMVTSNMVACLQAESYHKIAKKANLKTQSHKTSQTALDHEDFLDCKNKFCNI